MPGGRLLDECAVIPLFAPLDIQAGADAKSVGLAKGAELTIILTLGAGTTGDTVLSLFSGATSTAKTTALPFKTRKTGANIGAAASDVFDAPVTQAGGTLTLVAATYGTRAVVLEVDAADLPDGHSFVTLQVGGEATVALMSGVAIVRGLRYKPPTTML